MCIRDRYNIQSVYTLQGYSKQNVEYSLNFSILYNRGFGLTILIIRPIEEVKRLIEKAFSLLYSYYIVEIERKKKITIDIPRGKSQIGEVSF